MTKSFLTEYRLELSALLSVVFGLLSVVGLIGATYIKVNGSTVTFKIPGGLSFLQDLIQPFGSWVTWIAVIAPIGLIVCLWWFYDYVTKTRKLSRLIDTPSKAKFVRNIDDIEYLAWVLPNRFEQKVIKKKREFRI